MSTVKKVISAIGIVLMLVPVCHTWSATVYVSLSSSADGPGSGWSNAFHTIQGGVNAASTGDTVLVSNGVYETGGRSTASGIVNRVFIDKPLTLLSLNGPDVTFIKGGGTNGTNAVRCLYLEQDALVSGFTITNGHTHTNWDESTIRGGGILCQSDATISNCVITGNHADNDGGGVCGGTLYQCTLSGNIADSCGGGAANSTLYNCIISGNCASNNGGGTYRCELYNCTVEDNYAYYNGGGTYGGTLHNCIIKSNEAGIDGGGTHRGVLYNCTIVDNLADWYGGGTHESDLFNSIVIDNMVKTNTDNWTAGTLRYTCTTPLPPDTGNIQANPSFEDTAAGDYHLKTNSPCIDAGNNTFVATATDLEGTPRIINTVDLGAYEYIVSETDYDGDGIANTSEEKCGTDPLDATSIFRIRMIRHQQTNGARRVLLSWPSGPGGRFTIQSTTDIKAGFTNVVISNIVANPPANIYRLLEDATGTIFYRISLEE